ncbi:MAG TPA: hypothetical protein VMV72_03930 [Verrucomicrobiae bacterium]|nr:hypothetical protein [Verrucomicrobiae bacterium]
MSQSTSKKIWWLTALAISGWYFTLRLPGLLAIPIFNDEAIFLRWAQLIRQAPWRNALVCLGDPKPPLHPWLLALAGSVIRDPLLAGRLVSVLAGFLTLWAVAGFCLELHHWRTNPDRGDSGELFVLLAVLLVLVCPYVAFNQRLALVDSSFVLASVSAAWMSLRARRRLDGNLDAGRGLLFVALPLGLIMAVALLSRPIVSYTLWLLPPLALFAPPAATRPIPRRWGAATLWLAVAFILACVLWLPWIGYGVWHSVIASWPTIKLRLVYHPDYARPLSLPDRLVQIKTNFIKVCIPTAEGQASIHDIVKGITGQPQTGWYWFYLTPPVYLLSLISLVYLSIRREWRGLLFLGCYAAAMAAPFILVGTRFYSRHLLYGAVPLLIGLAWMLADVLGEFMRRSRARMWCGVGIVCLLLAPSCRQILFQDFEPAAQVVTLDDRLQYLNGWASGYASTRAVQVIKDLAQKQPVVVITTSAWGMPADAFWVYLDRYPNVRVYYVDWFGKQPVLTQVEPGKYLLRRDKWALPPPPAEPVTIAPDTAVFFVGDPFPGADETGKVLHQHDQVVDDAVRFYNNEFVGGPAAGDGAWMYRLRLPIMLAPAAVAPPSVPAQVVGAFRLTEGWHLVERNGSDWSCWTYGRGRLSIAVSNDTLATLSGQILSAQRPNDADILVNNVKLASVSVDWTNWEFRSFPPVKLPLKAGENTLEFVSQKPPIRIGTDGRDLAVAVKNLVLTTTAE